MPDEMTVEKLVEEIKSDDADRRTRAWLRASEVGAAALAELANVMETGELEVSRCAKKGMWKIARAAGAPGAPNKTATIEALLELLDPGRAVAVRREVLWMLSEIAGDNAVEPIAALLKDEELQQDACMVLQRIPGKAAIQALQAGFDMGVAEKFKYCLAQSLRARGVEVSGYPSQKLVPDRPTKVQELE
jgi:hypothetical protein